MHNSAMQGRDIVIVGAGILGAAVAWQLARMGAGGRVLLLERDMPMAAATSRAAALVTVLRDDVQLVRMAQETLAAIHHLEQTMGDPVGLHPVGSLHVVPAHLRDRYDRQVAQCVAAGARMQWVPASYARQRAPWLVVPQDAQVLHCMDDCYVDPYQLGMAYLRHAQRAGAQLRLQAPVDALLTEQGRVTGVQLASGECIAAPAVVVAAGAWSNALTVAQGVPLPMAAVRSQYWITAPAQDVAPDGAIVFLPGIRAYVRPEVGGLLFGLREAHSVAVDARLLPSDLSGFSFDQADPEGWNALVEEGRALAPYWPGLDSAHIAHHVTGPSNYTTDGQLIVGAADALAGLWLATGCNGSGITFSAGVGRLLAEHILGSGPPFVDASRMAVQRLGDFNPYDPAFIQSCAQARSGKATG
jgi:sarcosine oxidase subunit beta